MSLDQEGRRSNAEGTDAQRQFNFKKADDRSELIGGLRAPGDEGGYGIL